MWFYFLAARYFEVGIEAIHFGQVEIMDDRDPDHSAWRDLLGRSISSGEDRSTRLAVRLPTPQT